MLPNRSLPLSSPLAVHVLVQQTADERRADRVADDARYEVVHKLGVVKRGAEGQFARHVYEVFV